MRFEMPALPDPDEPVADLIDRRRKSFRRLDKSKKAQKWMPVRVPEPGRPFGIAWVGDPHLDDPGCDWDTLLRDIETMRRSDGMHAVAIGDATNNWVGGLLRKFADQETTQKDARRLAAWFARDCGVPWLMWLVGNHDEWNEGKAILGLIAEKCLYIPGWSAKLEFVAGVSRFKVHCAHDFPGHSMWNPTHAGGRAARFLSDAELFVSGHRHNWAHLQFPMPDRVVNVVALGSYKKHDEYAERCGFPECEGGETIVTIFNPASRSRTGRIKTFGDLAEGADYLRFLRGRK